MGIFDIFKRKANAASPVHIGKESENKLHDNKNDITLRRSIYGLTPEEILFLEYASGHDADLSTFSQKYQYEYGMDYHETISFLINNNYIRTGTVEESLDLYSIQDFKKFLREFGLPVSGDKATLIQRIVNSQIEYSNKFTRCKYILTDKGSNVIDKYKSDHNLPKSEQEKLNFQFMEYGKNIQKHLQEGNLGLYACDLYSISEVYRKEHCYNDQLKVLMESAYIHLSGIGLIKDFNIALSNNFKHIGLDPILPPAVIRGIKMAMKNLNMDISLFKIRYKEVIDETLTPIHVFGVDKSLEIICLYLEDNTEKAEKEMEQGIKKFQSTLKKYKG